MFTLLDRVPYVELLLNDLESFIFSEGLMVMKANYETITNVFFTIYRHLYPSFNLDLGQPAST
jgi:hypothetical protein